VPVVPEIPEGVGGEPVVAIAVEDDGVVVGDPPASHQLSEGLGGQEVALHLVLEVLPPIEPDRARDVGLGVQGRVLIDLDDSDRLVVEALRDPVGGDEDVVRVLGHCAPP
jgi:hypothetical protein